MALTSAVPVLFIINKLFVLGFCELHIVKDAEKNSNRGTQTLQNIQDPGLLSQEDQIHAAEFR